MRFSSRAQLLPLLVVPALIACSSDDDTTFGRGSGVPSGGTAGASGTAGLEVGGRAGAGGGKAGTGGVGGKASGGSGGSGGKSGSAGQGGGKGGAAGQGGGAGKGGASAGQGGGAGKAAAGSGGKAGNGGSAGAAGTGGVFPPGCGNAQADVGERCDGADDGTGYTCAELTGDLSAVGEPSCGACFPALAGCVSCRDGVRNGDESDLDCGGSVCADRCTLGMKCGEDGDCAAGLGCFGGICNAYQARLTVPSVHVPSGAVAKAGIAIDSILPLPEGLALTFTTSSAVTVGAWSLSEKAGGYDRVATVSSTANETETIEVLLDGKAPTTPPLSLDVQVLSAATGVTVTSIEATRGVCSFGAPGKPYPRALGASGPIDVAVGNGACVGVKLSDPSFKVSAVYAAGERGAVKNSGAGTYYADLSIPAELPLFPGLPAVSPGDLVVEVSDVAGATRYLLVPDALRFTAYTVESSATGVGTPTSPAGGNLQQIGAGQPGMLWQIKGTFSIPNDSQGFQIAQGVRVEGYPGTVLLGTFGASNGDNTGVTVSRGASLRNVSVSGGGKICVQLQNFGDATVVSSLYDVSVSGCVDAIHAQGPSLMTGTGVGAAATCDVHGGGGGLWAMSASDMQVVGCTFTDNKFSGVRVDDGKLRAVRSTFVGNQVAGIAAGGGSLSIIDGTFERNSAAASATGGADAPSSVVLAGGSIDGKGNISAIGLRGEGPADRTVEARGTTIKGCVNGAIVATGSGTVTVSGGSIEGCGGPSTAAVSALGGETVLRGTRISGSLGDGINIEGGTLRLLGGSTLDASAGAGVRVAAGLFRSRAAAIRGASAPLLVVSAKGRLEIDDTDIVAYETRTAAAPLVSSARDGGLPTDSVGGLRLRAGAGATKASSTGTTCVDTQLADPVGGVYVTVSGPTPFCF